MPEVDPEILELPAHGRIRATHGRIRDFAPVLIDHRPTRLRARLRGSVRTLALRRKDIVV
jgi:hypothetical protein